MCMKDEILRGCPFKVVKNYIFWTRDIGNTKTQYEVDYYIPDIELAIDLEGRGNAYMRRALLRQKGVRVMLLNPSDRPNWKSIAENMPRTEQAFRDENKDFKGREELYLQEEKLKYSGYDIVEPKRNMTMAEAMDMAQ